MSSRRIVGGWALLALFALAMLLPNAAYSQSPQIQGQDNLITPPNSGGAADNTFGWTSLFTSAKSVQCADSNNTGFPDWQKLCMVAMAVGVLIAAFGHVMNGLLGGAKHSAFVKGLLWGLIESAVIFSVLVASMTGLQEVGETNINMARGYSTIIKNTAVMDFTGVLLTSTFITFFAKQNPSIRVPGVEGIYVAFNMGAMFRPIFDALGMIMQLITTSIAEWTAHEFLMCFIKNSMLSLMLPAGIFLRIFGIKNAANALIGLALALYFVYPWMMVIIGSAITDHFVKEIKVIDPGSEDAKHWLCAGRPICCLGLDPQPNNFQEQYIRNGETDNTLEDRISLHKVLEGESVLPEIGSAKTYCVFSTGLTRAHAWVIGKFGTLGAGITTLGIAAAMNLVAEYFNVSFIFVMAVGPAIVYVIEAIYESVFFLFVVSLVLPIFSIFVTITVAKEFAKLLGTEIDLSAIEKII